MERASGILNRLHYAGADMEALAVVLGVAATVDEMSMGATTRETQDPAERCPKP